MSGPQNYSLVAAARSLAAWWHEFFHGPQDVRVCAAVRIAYAAVLLVNLAVLYPDLDLWYTDQGILPVAASQRIGDPFQWSILWHVPATSAVVHACYWLLVGHTVLLLVGLASRLNAVCVLVWLISFHNRNVQILDGEDFVFRLIALFLMLMPCGAAWSVDAWIVRWWRGASEPANYLRPAWGLRLLQIQMAVIFLSAGLYKLGTEAWFEGTALYFVARLDDYFGRFPVPTWLFDTPWMVALMTWGVVAGELLIPVFVWFRETRRIALVAAVLFHLGNEWTMHLFLFHWIMLVGWLSFVQPGDLAWLRRKPVQ
jgi:uncharacterized membrane protein YphA (DoxX/SURF4 family)